MNNTFVALWLQCQSCEKSMQEIATNKEVIEMLKIKNRDLAAQLNHEKETNTSRVEQLNAEVKRSSSLLTMRFPDPTWVLAAWPFWLSKFNEVKMQ